MGCGLSSSSNADRSSSMLMIGLDGVGKTSILYKLKYGTTGSPAATAPTPTAGFNLESVKYTTKKSGKNKNTTVHHTCHLWDLAGTEDKRRLWQHYYGSVAGIIFVIDATDAARIDLARNALWEVMRSPQLKLKGTRVLIFCNKMDAPVNAMSVDDIHTRLVLSEVPEIPTSNWHIQACSAKTGDGLYEGLDWLLQ